MNNNVSLYLVSVGDERETARLKMDGTRHCLFEKREAEVELGLGHFLWEKYRSREVIVLSLQDAAYGGRARGGRKGGGTRGAPLIPAQKPGLIEARKTAFASSCAKTGLIPAQKPGLIEALSPTTLIPVSNRAPSASKRGNLRRVNSLGPS